jgi:hypothetical protein
MANRRLAMRGPDIGMALVLETSFQYPPRRDAAPIPFSGSISSLVFCFVAVLGFVRQSSLFAGFRRVAAFAVGWHRRIGDELNIN